MMLVVFYQLPYYLLKWITQIKESYSKRTYFVRLKYSTIKLCKTNSKTYADMCLTCISGYDFYQANHDFESEPRIYSVLDKRCHWKIYKYSLYSADYSTIFRILKTMSNSNGIIIPTFAFNKQIFKKFNFPFKSMILTFHLRRIVEQLSMKSSKWHLCSFK